jgi:hypothetical protein
MAVPRSQRVLCVVRTAGKPGPARQARHGRAEAHGFRQRRSALATRAAVQTTERRLVLLDLVPAGQHQPDLFAPDNQRRPKLSLLVDRNRRRAIGFGLFPPGVRAFKGNAA